MSQGPSMSVGVRMTRTVLSWKTGINAMGPFCNLETFPYSQCEVDPNTIVDCNWLGNYECNEWACNPLSGSVTPSRSIRGPCNTQDQCRLQSVKVRAAPSGDGRMR